MNEYRALMDAAHILADARNEVNREDGFVTSPAWWILHHALQYIEQQANVVLRGE